MSSCGKAGCSMAVVGDNGIVAADEKVTLLI